MPLYKKYKEQQGIFKESERIFQTLSDKSNPLNKVRNDLGLTNVLEREYLKNIKNLEEIRTLQGQYKRINRVIHGKLILEHCVRNNFYFDKIRNYYATIPNEVLQIIKDFSDKNRLDLSEYSNNFYILAPRKFFYKDNRDLLNKQFNIYFLEEDPHRILVYRYYIEVYDSNLKNIPFYKAIGYEQKELNFPVSSMEGILVIIWLILLTFTIVSLAIENPYKLYTLVIFIILSIGIFLECFRRNRIGYIKEFVETCNFSDLK